MTDTATADTAPEQPAFEVADLDTAMRAFRHIRTARSRIEEIDATAERELARLRADIERVEAWVEQETQADRRDITWWRGQLAAFLERTIAANPNGPKHVDTPYGRVSRRALPPQYVRDTATLQAWAAANGYTKRVERIEVDWDTIRRHSERQGGQLITREGVVVDGVQVVDREPEFRVDVDG